jgi:peptide/nickel transport system substrate-binding protein
MKLRSCLLFAGISIVVMSARVETARRPRYGGTLRVEVGPSVSSLDPAVPATKPEEAATRNQIDALIYERGEPAGAWELTGPFRISEWQPGRELTLTANDDFHGGRPFVDTIEIQMGRPERERLVDLELNKIDFAEIPPEQARRAAERGIRESVSKPDELMAIFFVPGRAAADDARVREAIARSIDRSSLVNFILQKEGEATDSLLPQWSSGTAFLFPTAADAAGAKELWQQISPSPKIVLGYDANDPLEGNMAERMVVNAREAGIGLTILAIPRTTATAATMAGGNGASAVDAQLIRWQMPSPRPREALMGFQQEFVQFGYSDSGSLPERASAEQIFDRERMLLDGSRVVPLVWLPHVYGLSARVRDWVPPGPGEGWPLADVWLEGEGH